MTQPVGPGSAGNHTPAPQVGIPRWVKVFLIVAAALVVLLVALMVFSGGEHGPGRHFSSAGLLVRELSSPPLGSVGRWA